MDVRGPVVIVALFAASCVVEGVDFTAKRCPCADDWVCDTARDVCVEPADAMDAGARPDTGPADAEPMDGTVDADAPVPDAGEPMDSEVRSDAGADAAPEPDPTACDDTLSGALFCDGFEADDGFASWSEGPGLVDGTLTRVTDPTHRGTGAVRAEITAASGHARLRTRFPIAIDGDLWLRMYVLLPDASEVTHFDVAALRETTAPADGVALGIRDTQTMLWLDEPGMSYPTPSLLPRDVWTCIQVSVTVSDTEGELELHLAGDPEVMATAVDTSPAGGLGLLEVGITWSATTQGATAVYFDEVAVGRSELPCDP